MSKVAIQGNASGTGVFTIAAPNTNTDRTLTLPDSAGTMMLTDTGVTTAQMPAGSVLQVVSAVKNDNTTTTSTSFVDITGLSVSITPRSATSKILIQVMLGCVGNATNAILFNLLRNSTVVAQPSSGTNPAMINHYAGFTNAGTASNMTFLDSPASTSSITYKLQFRVDSATGAINQHPQNSGYTAISTITAMEIAG